MPPLAMYPANPEVLFTAVDEAYDLLEVMNDKRQLIKDEIRKLNQVEPTPLARLRELNDQLNQINAEISKGEAEAARLNRIAMLKLLNSSDVVNATKVMECTTGKAKLALNNLDEFQNFLAVSAAIVKLVADIASAAAAAPLSFLAIASIIENFDSLVHIELVETLSPDELEKIMPKIQVDCTKAA